MGFLSILLIAIGLAMDSFAVSLSIGTAQTVRTFRPIFRVIFHLGFIQGLITFLGWLAGTTISGVISSFDHWLAFGLLSLVGIRMIRGGLSKKEEHCPPDPSRGGILMMLCIATSIDALAVGLSFAMLEVNILYASLIIMFVTFVFAFTGIKAGSSLGSRFGKTMEIIGGLILVAIGIRILLSHIL